MKDSDIKNLFANLAVPAPSAGFEDAIIARALKPRRSAFAGYAAVAAMCLFIVSGSLMLHQTPTDSSAQYAAILDDSIASDDDVYDGLIGGYSS